METCPNKRFFLFNQIMNQTEIPQKREPKIKNRIRYCRLAINLSQKDLAFLMGVPASQVSRWETGERDPLVYNAVGLAVATHRLVEDVFFDYRQEWQERIRERMKLLG